ncbi:hypothetical protein [Sunxiuqinia dokdonensis]|uniref:Uncharacterized protein n=1 Tax=Sunxiuqinia dokdonensis TaxID=1409788 RepID=A0A0L8V4B9_9BACT|nr:hypothetical protein [Sunxiuqinia dokdonensis]KOH43335.1 hypothetical protein NC99_38950 [Sunxiuqinia dokdonensis]
MDALIRKAGQILYLLDLRIRKLLYYRILRNHTSMILFIWIFLTVIFLTVLWGLGYPSEKAIMYSIGLSVVFFIMLVLMGAYYEAKRLQANELNSCFHFTRSNMNGILISELGFSETDRENLNLVLNNLQPKSKIDFKLVSDNRIAADYKKLLRVIHLLIVGGIRDFKKEQKELLFKFVEANFTLNGSPVNRASFNSRFSELVNEKEQEFQNNLEPFQKALRK